MLKLFTILDVKSKLYLPPFHAQAKGQAIRMFADSANDSSSVVSKYPTDFALMEIGSFDEQSGELSRLAVPESLGLAVEYVREQKPLPLELVGRKADDEVSK